MGAVHGLIGSHLMHVVGDQSLQKGFVIRSFKTQNPTIGKSMKLCGHVFIHGHSFRYCCIEATLSR